MPRQSQPESATVAKIRFSNRDHPDLGIDAFTLSSLLARIPDGALAGPQRLEFHLLILCLKGRGARHVDFVRYEWTPATVLHVRPGQVQQFELQADMEALLILFTPMFMSTELDRMLLGSQQGVGDTRIQLDMDSDCHRRVSDVFLAITEDYRAVDASPVSARLLHHELHALLLRLRRLSSTTTPAMTADATHLVCDRFLADLERRYTQTRQVASYAASLGYSVKTLGRACLRVAGAPPKKLIEQRVLLEAKRLLVHSQMGIKGVAGELGFSEETNFVKFFRRMEGVPPAAFRARFRRTAG